MSKRIFHSPSPVPKNRFSAKDALDKSHRAWVAGQVAEGLRILEQRYGSTVVCADRQVILDGEQAVTRAFQAFWRKRHHWDDNVTDRLVQAWWDGWQTYDPRLGHLTTRLVHLTFWAFRRAKLEQIRIDDWEGCVSNQAVLANWDVPRCKDPAVRSRRQSDNRSRSQRDRDNAILRHPAYQVAD